MQYNQREIVLVPFPYSDLSNTKRRPVLIISNNDFNYSHEDVIVCVVTSNKFIDDYSVQITDDSLEYGILPEPSIVKVSKLFTINKSMILKKFSILNNESFNNILISFKKLFKLSG